MRRSVLLLVLFAFSQTAPTCGSGGGGGGPPAWIFLSPANINTTPGGLFVVDVMIQPGGSEVQAYDLTVRTDPAVALPLIVFPDAEFDDDGKFFIDPDYSLAGEVSGIIDLRHGTPVTTPVIVARVVIRAEAAGSTTIEVEAQGIASPSGGSISVQHFGTELTVAQ